MSALEKFMRLVDEEEAKTTKPVSNTPKNSYIETRQEFIQYVWDHKWLIEKECQLLEEKMNSKVRENFIEKGKGWASIAKGINILNSLYV